MSINQNSVVLQGRLAADPEVKTVASGNVVVTFRIATSRSWKDKKGNKHDEVTFCDCQAWNGTGKVVADYAKKGKELLVRGRVAVDTWKDKTSGGNRRREFTLVNNVQLGRDAMSLAEKEALATVRAMNSEE